MSGEIKEEKNLAALDKIIRDNLHEYPGELALYGVILVVEVGDSENTLISDRPNGEGQRLKPEKQYADITDIRDITTLSHVSTEVTIREVVYQTDRTQLAAGDSIQAVEKYFILDDRVPKLKSSPSRNEIFQFYREGTIEWIPMTKGNTYLIFGNYQIFHGSAKEVSGTIGIADYGVYCLSSPNEQAGFEKDAATFTEGIAYLKANYDFAKYGLK